MVIMFACNNGEICLILLVSCLGDRYYEEDIYEYPAEDDAAYTAQALVLLRKGYCEQHGKCYEYEYSQGDHYLAQ